MLDFKPDWSDAWTIEEAERELLDFEFLGPGWYYDKDGGAMLVVPSDCNDRSVWHAERDRREYTFHVWNGRNPFSAFARIAAAPVRKDDSIKREDCDE